MTKNEGAVGPAIKGFDERDAALYQILVACDSNRTMGRSIGKARKMRASWLGFVALAVVAFGALSLLENINPEIAWTVAIVAAVSLSAYLLLSRQSK